MEPFGLPHLRVGEAVIAPMISGRKYKKNVLDVSKLVFSTIMHIHMLFTKIR